MYCFFCLVVKFVTFNQIFVVDSQAIVKCLYFRKILPIFFKWSFHNQTPDSELWVYKPNFQALLLKILRPFLFPICRWKNRVLDCVLIVKKVLNCSRIPLEMLQAIYLSIIIFLPIVVKIFLVALHFSFCNVSNFPIPITISCKNCALMNVSVWIFHSWYVSSSLVLVKYLLLSPCWIFYFLYFTFISRLLQKYSIVPFVYSRCTRIHNLLVITSLMNKNMVLRQTELLGNLHGAKGQNIYTYTTIIASTRITWQNSIIDMTDWIWQPKPRQIDFFDLIHSIELLISSLVLIFH